MLGLLIELGVRLVLSIASARVGGDLRRILVFKKEVLYPVVLPTLSYY